MRDRSILPPWLWPRAAYLHIPFCAHRCGYCDFAVTAEQDHLIDLYIESIGEELSRLEEPTAVQTIFLGGGTPTYLDPSRLSRLLALVNYWLPLSVDGEFSIEATPESVSADTVAVLADHQVNRVSLGVQSFNPRLLAQLDRIHRADEVAPAFERIRKRIANVSLDLIFGVPSQSPRDWEVDLDTALSLEPDHLSTYGLTYEKGTALWKQRERGQVSSLSEGDELAMYLHAMNRLTEAGFEQYEISNFARPGRRCRHNETYWANEAYFGFGVGSLAMSCVAGNSIGATLPSTFELCFREKTRPFKARSCRARSPRENRLRSSFGGRKESIVTGSANRRGSHSTNW